MGILIGMDEAGYGPHYGPLVVAATAWEVPEEGFAGHDSDDGEVASAGGELGGGTATAVRRAKRQSRHDGVDLYRLLRNIVAKSASERRIAIADSKLLYHPGNGLRQLERGLHAVLQTMQQSLGCWSAIVRFCEADPDGHHQRVCWPDGFDCSLPVDAALDELARLAARFSRTCGATGVRPLAIRARLVFPEQFNDLVAYYDSKGEALSHVTVGLLRELMDVICPSAVIDGLPPSAFRPPPSIYAVCDKHGGRNFYTALLQHHFSEHWIEPVFESHAVSRYEWGPPEARVRVTFRVNGETFMPTALASMTAKYLRELAMRAFNEFWCARVPDLRPTAGYYRDSWRFKKEIAAKQRELGIDDHVLWRNR
ncbi:MAG: hypothetical protein WD738_08835 [Pirellulales bacterium]